MRRRPTKLDDGRTRQQVEIPQPTGEVLIGDLVGPDDAAGVVVFAHGTGSSRHSPRNRMVAGRLHERGFATLLLDLLTAPEEDADRRTGHLRFDIGLLAGRLQAALHLVREHDATAGRRLGLFGASTGAAAALVAAGREGRGVAAVVSRGGRPDLAGDELRRVVSPTLLIVGERDETVIALNGEAYAELPEPKRFELVAGATHLFEEPGALEQVALMAGDWFADHLR